jgi:predicted RNA-binding protein with PUA-like domain
VKYWLLKSEPTTFGINHLAAAPRRTTEWSGVRNFQARNMLRDEMKKGDLGFFYHSSCDVPGIYGIVKVVKAGYPDHSAFDPKDDHYDAESNPAEPRWYMVDVQLVRRFDAPVTLDELKRHSGGALAGMQVLKRGNRLSITPVSPAEWRYIESLAGKARA